MESGIRLVRWAATVGATSAGQVMRAKAPVNWDFGLERRTMSRPSNLFAQDVNQILAVVLASANARALPKAHDSGFSDLSGSMAAEAVIGSLISTKQTIVVENMAIKTTPASCGRNL